ncbi:hypothetical protein C8R44DRAFT_650543, partial [Mycena epipterygia]
PHFCMILPWMDNGTITEHLERNGCVDIDQRVSGYTSSGIVNKWLVRFLKSRISTYKKRSTL